ncbi:NADH-quinone oxidoreductase subunit NuoE [Hoeflea prorocentri]|uniref:NADH-quinone oxidoreductase subunit NuoE n=1 Tax=Hoeflea prorocentri TaxID=1922333 RepID=A0A9X3ZG68_9HYPH|nr:NADH-quinone oxidoreductase subunit NuoE [Hoeflea prorocentri]MCY6380457.1 NADH-quinone oxidoreductase subunit NuoE [Hoeflea prorocentri]MDA5398257.1 NADH-quinone oxidoreductase subunit NuoE [Hoeflea prorocentri]
MSVRRLAEDSIQPEQFRFSRENAAWAKATIKKYPKGRQQSAIIPLLMRAQEQDGWVTKAAIESVADMLQMPYIRALEVATFYTQFQLKPVGTHAHVQVCGTTPCMLRGSEDLIKVCKNKISEHQFETNEAGTLSWEEVECQGACVNAPMVMIFKDAYEDLTPEQLADIIDRFEAGEGENVTPGPQNGRHLSAPIGGLTTLTDGKANAGAKSNGKAAVKAPKKPKEVAASDGVKPAAMEEPDEKDDLKMLSGVGPKIEGVLNSIGIFKFEQVAAWKEAECAWVDGFLKFKGRIEREQWVKQAEALAKGGVEEYVRVFGKKPR